MTTKNINWKTMGPSIGNDLKGIEVNRNDLPAAFDSIRETILSHLSLYIDKRHMIGFRVQIESADKKIKASLRFENKTICKWSI